jgi:protein tyrosine phosphatase (PTP) superfamily phosphohydrolase (DUF442 family)
MKFLVGSLLVSLALASCVAPAPTRRPPPPPPTPERDLASPVDPSGVGNFARITDGLWRGRQPTAEGFATLKSMGVKTVVNLRTFHSDRKLLGGLGLTYCNLKSYAYQPDDENVAAFLKVAIDPSCQPVFVHCEHGVDRTGVFLLAYRVVVQGWPTDKARREMRNFGFRSEMPGLTHYLDNFDPERIRGLMDTAKPRMESIP